MTAEKKQIDVNGKEPSLLHSTESNANDIVKDEEKPAHPVDTGWAWVVLAASSCMVFTQIGILKSFGIFFIEFLEEFKGNVTSTSLVTTLQTIAYCIVAPPVLTIGVKRISVRTLIILGNFFIALSYGLSSLATSLTFMYFSYSMLLGTGIAFAFGPNLINIGKYFNKKIGLANGILFSSHSLGGFALPYLCRHLFDKYGLRGALLLTAGVSLQTVVFSALLRPTENYKRKKTNSAFMDSNQYDEQTFDLQHDNSRRLSLFSKSQPLITSTKKEDVLSTETRIRTSSFSPGHSNTQNQACKKISKLSRYMSNEELFSVSISDLTEKRESLSPPNDVETSKNMLSACFKNKIFDFTVFRNSTFAIYLPIYVFGAVCPSLSNIFIPPFAKDMGSNDRQVTILISVINLADCGGRFLVGYLADKPWISKQKLLIISQTVLGVLMFLNSFYTEFYSLVIMCALFGLVMGSMFTLFSPIVIEMVGVDRFGNAMVILLTIQQAVIGGIIPAFGYLKDVTGAYYGTLYCMGACSFLSALLLILCEIRVTVINRYFQKGQEIEE